MRDRRRALAASRADALRPTPLAVRDATPSQRDFAQYVATGKRGLGAIAGIADGPASAAVAQAQAYDEAEVAAIAVDTSGGALAVADMSVIARATTAPILYDALVLNHRQILQARLFGADAVILPANELVRFSHRRAPEERNRAWAGPQMLGARPKAP